MQARYFGTKALFFEGAEAFIPLLETIAEVSAAGGVEEVASAWRTAGSEPCATLWKIYEQMFKKFEGSEFNPYQIDGDVKYHLGFASERSFNGKKVRLYLSPNSKSLEYCKSGGGGICRSRQEFLEILAVRKLFRCSCMVMLPFIGQGLTAETLNLRPARLHNWRNGPRHY